MKKAEYYSIALSTEGEAVENAHQPNHFQTDFIDKTVEDFKNVVTRNLRNFDFKNPEEIFGLTHSVALNFLIAAYGLMLNAKITNEQILYNYDAMMAAVRKTLERGLADRKNPE